MNGARAIAVLGGGITGLIAAYRLAQRGHRVRLFERSGRIGGAIGTESTGGWLVERGPNSFQAAEPEILPLLHELGLDDEIVAPGPLAKNRYVAQGKKLVAVPSSPPGLLGTPLFSLAAKGRVLRELFRKPERAGADMSFAEFIRQHFGPEVLDRVVQPFVSGIYAGDAEALSTQHAFPKLWALAQKHGSLLRAQMAVAKARRARGEPAVPKIISFRRGLQTLPDALATRIGPGAIVLGAQLEKLVPGKSWQVHWRAGEGGPVQIETFDAVVTALPASGLSALAIGANAETPLASLAAIPHPPVASLFLGFRREQVAHPLDGFGALVPASEKRSILGVIFSSSLFPGRAPTGHVALTVLVGGALQPQLAALPAPQLFAAVAPDLHELLGVTGEPVFQRQTLWPTAIPQYTLGYERHLAAIAACEQAHPGLFIGGQVRDGIALPACIAAGEKLAARSTA